MPDTWTKEKWEEVCGYGESEHYLVAAIKRHLLTPEQKAFLNKHDLSIEDVLNGRFAIRLSGTLTEKLFKPWNAVLGWKEFIEEI
jgi:hypothetical protein